MLLNIEIDLTEGYLRCQRLTQLRLKSICLSVRSLNRVEGVVVPTSDQEKVDLRV